MDCNKEVEDDRAENHGGNHQKGEGEPISFAVPQLQQNLCCTVVPNYHESRSILNQVKVVRRVVRCQIQCQECMQEARKGEAQDHQDSNHGLRRG